jgi:hypothetical protein
VLGLAVSAHAAVQNVKVSGDLKASAIGRSNFDLGASYTSQQNDASNVIMSQARLRVDADLTENVSTTVRLLNERDWGTEGQEADDTDIDLDLASVTLKELLYSPLTVTLGRQEIRLGNGFVVGDPDTNRTTTNAHSGMANRDKSLRKAFDAAKATLNYDPLIIDAFYSKIDENVQVGTGEDKDDIDLYGVNAKYGLGDDWKTALESYFLYRRDETTNLNTTDTGNKTDKVYAPGLRISTNPTDSLNLQGEIAWQFGTWTAPDAIDTVLGVSRRREAMAAQVMATLALPFEKLEQYSPVVGATYSYYSGDSNAADDTTGADKKYRAWDPLFEDQGTGISNVLFQATNVHVINFNTSVVPLDDVKLRFDYTELYLDRRLDLQRWTNPSVNLYTLYGIDGASMNPTMYKERHLGREFDLALAYDYTEDVQFGLSAGLFFPGSAFGKQDLTLKTASEVIGTCSVSF